MNSKYKYSVVISVYNSASRLAGLCARIDATFQKIKSPCQILLVDNSSTDNSWDEIKAIKQYYEQRAMGINLRKKVSNQNAILCGIQFATGDCVITFDSNSNFQPEDIQLLVEKFVKTKADLVYGVSIEELQMSCKVSHNSFQRFSNFRIIGGTLVNRIKGDDQSFTNIDRNLASYNPKTEIQLVKKNTLSNNNYVFDNINIKSLFNIYNLHIPLKSMIWLGLSSWGICCVIVMYFIYQKHMHKVPLGFTALIVSVFMSMGMILFSLGIIGEYLNRLLAIELQQPSYSIKEIL